jgi:hypothetical protein
MATLPKGLTEFELDDPQSPVSLAYGTRRANSTQAAQTNAVNFSSRAQLVSPVKPHRVCAEQPFHPFDQIRPRRLYHQVKMIAHQTVGVDLPPSLLAGCAQRL